VTANLIRTAADAEVVGFAWLMHRHAPRDVIRAAIAAYRKREGKNPEEVDREAWAYAQTIKTPARGLAGAAERKGTNP
jgi:hypothetical protein